MGLSSLFRLARLGGHLGQSEQLVTEPAAAAVEQEVPQLNHRGRKVQSLGLLRASSLDDPVELRRHLAEDGYLYLPGVLGRERVLAARMAMLRRVQAAAPHLLLGPLENARMDPGADRSGWDDAWGVQNVLVGNEEVHSPASAYCIGRRHADSCCRVQVDDVLFRGPMIDVYEKIFGEAVSHLDYRWLRVKRPADPGALPDVTPPHCDLVYMGRGSLDLLTSWTCFSDVGYDMGGLVLLEGSHRAGMRGAAALADDELASVTEPELTLGRYVTSDVDSHCEGDEASKAAVAAANAEGRELTAEEAEAVRNALNNRTRGMGKVAHEKESRTFQMGPDAQDARERIGLGGRFLTGNFRMGDLLLFSAYTLHSSLDNESGEVRISTDTRYQPASHPIDGRWVGDDASNGIHGHTAKHQRGRIC